MDMVRHYNPRVKIVFLRVVKPETVANQLANIFTFQATASMAGVEIMFDTLSKLCIVRSLNPPFVEQVLWH
jgi:hypothetical protein